MCDLHQSTKGYKGPVLSGGGNTKVPVPLSGDPGGTDRTVRLLRPDDRTNREGREVAGVRRPGVLHCHGAIIKTTLSPIYVLTT